MHMTWLGLALVSVTAFSINGLMHHVKQVQYVQPPEFQIFLNHYLCNLSTSVIRYVLLYRRKVLPKYNRSSWHTLYIGLYIILLQQSSPNLHKNFPQVLDRRRASFPGTHKNDPIRDFRSE